MPDLPTPPESYTLTHISWDGGWLEFDAVIRQTLELDGEISDHPVDEGADITDNYRPYNLSLFLEAEITNSPLRLPRTHTDGAIEIQDINIVEIPAPIYPGAPTSLGGFDITTKKRVTISTLNYEGLDRVNAVYEELLAIRDEVRILTVTLGSFGKPYDNMLLKRIQVDRDAASNNTMPLSLEFRRVSFADLQSVDLSGIVDADRKRREAAKARSKDKADAGKKGTEEKTNTSLAKRLANSALGG